MTAGAAASRCVPPRVPATDVSRRQPRSIAGLDVQIVVVHVDPDRPVIAAAEIAERVNELRTRGRMAEMRRLGRWHFLPWLVVPVYVVGAGSLAAVWPWLALPLFGVPPVAFVAAAIVSAARDNRRRLCLQRPGRRPLPAVRLLAHRECQRRLSRMRHAEGVVPSHLMRR